MKKMKFPVISVPSTRDQARMLRMAFCVYPPNHPPEKSGQAALRAPLLEKGRRGIADARLRTTLCLPSTRDEAFADFAVCLYTDNKIVYKLMFTQTADFKYVKKNLEYKVYALCAKCTPKRTPMIFVINTLAIIIRKKQENVHPYGYLYGSLPLLYMNYKTTKMLKNVTHAVHFTYASSPDLVSERQITYSPISYLCAFKHQSIMGRAFEFRRARKEKRWDKMAKAFTRLGREIAISVKLGGPNPDTNPRLRVAMQNAKGVNMPKDKVEAAIKRASSKEEKDFEEVVYEGYGPHGVAIVVETATDNTTRTVANVRMYFNKNGGSLGTSGSVNFMFERKGVIKMPADGINLEDLELDLIDYGAEDIFVEDGEITIYTGFTEFAGMVKALEERKLPVTSSELQRIPTNFAPALTESQEEEILNLIDKLEEDDDVQAVYHNMANAD